MKEQIPQKSKKKQTVPAQKTTLKGITKNYTVKIADKNTDFSRLRGMVKPNLLQTVPTATIIASIADPGSEKIGSMGSRTQVLIADGSAVDGLDENSMEAMWNLFANGGQPLADFYDNLYAKIPSNAAPTLDYSQGLVNQTEALSIDLSAQNTFDVIFAGIDSIYYYNPAYGFLNPAPEALQDNLICEDKWIYFFDYSYLAYVMLTEIPPFEIQAVTLETTPSSAELTATEPVTFTIRNVGNQSLTAIDFYVKIDDGDEIHESFTTPADSALDMGEFLTYTFAAKADFSIVGKHTIEARAEIVNEYDDSDNSLIINREHTTVGTLPFFDTFDYDLSNWAVIDRNGTDESGGGTWTPWIAYDADYNEDYQALYSYASDRQGDDWLRTARPYHLDAGNYYISFLQQGISETLPEMLNVYYGTSPDVASMTFLANFTVTNEILLKNIVNFSNSTAGDYYFAFQAASDPDMFGLIIDDVKIDAGALTPQPDLYLFQTFFKSYPSCELSDSAAVTVFNLGNIAAGIASFDLKYKVDNGAWQTKTVSEPLAAGNGTTVFLNNLDLSAVGQHTLTVVGVLDNQITNSNDTSVVSIEKTVPVTTLPYTSNFSNESDVNDWVVLTEGDWSVNNGYYTPEWVGVPLISKCVELQPGDYTLSLTFQAGMYFELFDMYSYGSYSIQMGEPGVEPSEWTDIIGFEENLYAPNDTTLAYEFSIEQADNYTFALIADYFRLKEVSISAGKLAVPPVISGENCITLFPNPTSDLVKIESKNAEIEKVTISDISGRIVFDSKQSFDRNDCRINVSSFSKGLYLVKIKEANSENVYVKKMLVK
ncbi:MAG: T9SS type A sorting domain-containing protein [Dysgonamonadaceae bacterium]|nr:T9SS type A sorting domain-containing protein [Dysgonamonadaceae bacterium]